MYKVGTSSRLQTTSPRDVFLDQVMQLSLGRAIGLIGQAYGEDQTLIENCDRMRRR